MRFVNYMLLTEKLSKAQFTKILNDPKFKIGIEFEFYDKNMEDTANSKKLSDQYDELYNDISTLIDELDTAHNKAVENNNKIIDKAIEKLQTKQEKSNDEEDIEIIEDDIDRLIDGKSYYGNYEDIDDLIDIDDLDYEYQYEEDTINDHYPNLNDYPDLIEYWKNQTQDVGHTIKTIVWSLIEDGSVNRLGMLLDENGLSSSFADDDSFVNLEDFPKHLFPYEVHIDYSDNYSIWRLMDDASLQHPTGVEITSPILNLKDGLTALKDVLDYIKQNGETSSLTGLHINMSYGDFKIHQLNFMKMVLFADEKHIDKKFQDRIHSQYVEFIQDVIKTNPEGKAVKHRIYNNKHELERYLKMLFPITRTAKSKSINVSNFDRVEFRYLGGQDYEKKFEEIKKFIIHFAELFKLGMDEEYKKKEYMKKLAQFHNLHINRHKENYKKTLNPLEYDIYVKDLDGNTYIGMGENPKWVYKYHNGGLDKKGTPLPNVKVDKIPLKKMIALKKQNPYHYDGEFSND